MYEECLGVLDLTELLPGGSKAKEVEFEGTFIGNFGCRMYVCIQYEEILRIFKGDSGTIGNLWEIPEILNFLQR